MQIFPTMTQFLYFKDSILTLFDANDIINQIPASTDSFLEQNLYLHLGSHLERYNYTLYMHKKYEMYVAANRI